MLDNIKNIVRKGVNFLYGRGFNLGTDEEQAPLRRRERAIVFLTSYILALALWFMVNISKDYSFSINMPIEAVGLPANQALSQNLPEEVAVSVNGDWVNITAIFNTPPTITLDVSEERDFELFNEVRNQMNNYPGIRIDKVQPSLVSVSLEDQVRKKVPIRLDTDITFQDRYDMVGEPLISPDSVMITGAASQVDVIEEWVVQDLLTIENARTDINETLSLASSNPLVVLSESEVTYSAKVSEFTEGEAIALVRTVGLPRGRSINYFPSSITIKYDIPIEEFADAESRSNSIFEVYVDYQKILTDSTGYVTPDITTNAAGLNIRLRSFQPRTIAYYSIVDEQGN